MWCCKAKPDERMSLEEGLEPEGFAVSKEVRHGFIRKVYGILTAQLVLTFGVVMVFTHVDPVKEYAVQNPWMYWLGLVVTFCLMLGFTCCEGPRRKVPLNYVCLGVFTLAEGRLLSQAVTYIFSLGREQCTFEI